MWNPSNETYQNIGWMENWVQKYLPNIRVQMGNVRVAEWIGRLRWIGQGRWRHMALEITRFREIWWIAIWQGGRGNNLLNYSPGYRIRRISRRNKYVIYERRVRFFSTAHESSSSPRSISPLDWIGRLF